MDDSMCGWGGDRGGKGVGTGYVFGCAIEYAVQLRNVEYRESANEQFETLLYNAFHSPSHGFRDSFSELEVGGSLISLRRRYHYQS